MDVLTRENGIIAGCVVLAIVAFSLLGTYTDLSDWALLAVVIVVGVLLPGRLTGWAED